MKKAGASTKRARRGAAPSHKRKRGKEPPQRKRGREEKEPPPPKRRNGWLSHSLVVASRPCHAVVLCFSLSLLFCGGPPLLSPLVAVLPALYFCRGCVPSFFLRWFSPSSRFFCCCVLCLFCVKEAGTTTGKRENSFFSGSLLRCFRVLVLLPLTALWCGSLMFCNGGKAKPPPSQNRERPPHKRKRRRGQEPPPPQKKGREEKE